MKGIHQRKHRVAWEEGKLKLSPKPLSYQGNTHAWTRNIDLNDYENWTVGNHEEAVQHVFKEKLESLTSPCCRRDQATGKLKLKSHGAFSQLKCTHCGDVSSTALWRCTCDQPWYKCSLHLVQNSMGEAFKFPSKSKRDDLEKACPLFAAVPPDSFCHWDKRRGDESQAADPGDATR